MDVSAAMSAFGVLCGMTVPMLCLPTAFIGAMGLVLVPKLSQSVALGRMDKVRRRIYKALLATSVLVMPALAILVVLGPTIGVYLFREATVGRYMVPLSVGVLLSCYQSVLSGVLSGIGRQAAAARSSLICGAVQLGCTWVLIGLPGVGLGGYVAGFVLSSALGALLNYWEVSRRTGLKPRLFQWLSLIHIFTRCGRNRQRSNANCTLFFIFYVYS